MRDVIGYFAAGPDKSRAQRGQAFVDYVLILLLVVVLAVLFFKGVGRSVFKTFGTVDSAMQGGFQSSSSASLWERVWHSR